MAIADINREVIVYGLSEPDSKDDIRYVGFSSDIKSSLKNLYYGRNRVKGKVRPVTLWMLEMREKGIEPILTEICRCCARMGVHTVRKQADRLQANLNSHRLGLAVVEAPSDVEQSEDKAIVRNTASELKKNPSMAVDLFDMLTFKLSCATNGWDQDSRIAVLSEIARDRTDRRAQLAAVKYIDDLAAKALEMSGEVRKTTVTSVSDGVTVEDKFMDRMSAGSVRQEEVVIDVEAADAKEAEVEHIGEQGNADESKDGADESKDGADELQNSADEPDETVIGNRWGQRPPTKFTEGFTGLSGTPDGHSD